MCPLFWIKEETFQHFLIENKKLEHIRLKTENEIDTIKRFLYFDKRIMGNKRRQKGINRNVENKRKKLKWMNIS